MMMNTTAALFRSASRMAVAQRALPASGTVLPSTAVTKRGYHENIVEHYENPRNVGSLDKTDLSVGTVRSQTGCRCQFVSFKIFVRFGSALRRYGRRSSFVQFALCRGVQFAAGALLNSLAL